MKKRYMVLLGVVGFLGLGALGGPSADELKNVDVHAALHRGGFGLVTLGSFTIVNNNSFAIKDPTVRCSHQGASGTEVDYNTSKIYHDVSPGSSSYVDNINMGFTATQQIVRSVCTVTSFTKVKAS